MIDNDDLNQEAALRLLLLRTDQLDTYECLKHARNARRAARRRQRTYDRYVGQLEARLLPDGETLEVDEYLPGSEPTPEEVCISKETHRERLAALRNECRQVLILLAQGFSQGEAAEALGHGQTWGNRRIAEIREVCRNY